MAAVVIVSSLVGPRLWQSLQPGLGRFSDDFYMAQPSKKSMTEPFGQY
jgi:hypothetical protein